MLLTAPKLYSFYILDNELLSLYLLKLYILDYLNPFGDLEENVSGTNKLILFVLSNEKQFR